jgi:hypothetical protein
MYTSEPIKCWSRRRSWFSLGLGPENPGDVTLVTVEFAPHGDESELVLTHERFSKADLAQRYESGWGTIVEKFATYLSRHSSKTKRA